MKRRDWLSVAALSLIAMGSTHAAEKSIELKPFTRISSDLSADIRLVLGNKHAVHVVAEADVLKNIGIRVKKGVLMIQATGGFQTEKPIEVSIWAKAIQAVSMGGAASFSAKNVTAERLLVMGRDSATIEINKLNVTKLTSDLDDSSTASMTGNVGSHQVRIAGSASLEAQPLQSQSALVEVSEAGDAELNVVNELQVSIKGAGSVSYKGSPAVKQSIQGAGSVEKI